MGGIYLANWSKKTFSNFQFARNIDGLAEIIKTVRQYSDIRLKILLLCNIVDNFFVIGCQLNLRISVLCSYMLSYVKLYIELTVPLSVLGEFILLTTGIIQGKSTQSSLKSAQ